MSNTADVINLLYDILFPLGIALHKYNSPATEGERIVINAIPNTQQSRWGSNRMNRFVVNANCFIPKVQVLGLKEPDSARIAAVEKLIMEAIEAYNSISTRVKYYSLDPIPGVVFNENEKENLLNIRIETSVT